MITTIDKQLIEGGALGTLVAALLILMNATITANVTLLPKTTPRSIWQIHESDELFLVCDIDPCSG